MKKKPQILTTSASTIFSFLSKIATNTSNFHQGAFEEKPITIYESLKGMSEVKAEVGKQWNGGKKEGRDEFEGNWDDEKEEVVLKRKTLAFLMFLC